MNEPLHVTFETFNSCMILGASRVDHIAMSPDIPPEFLPVATQYTSDSVSLSFLIPGFEYRVTTDRALVRIKCPPSRIPYPFHILRLLVRPEHVGKEPLVSSAFSSYLVDEDYLFTDCPDAQFWLHLYCLGLFTLPLSDNLIGIPNPREKFCLQLDPSPSWKWTRKMRKATYKFVVDSVDSIGIEALSLSMGRILEKIAMHYSSTWVNELFIRNTVSLISADCPVQYYIFKLMDGEELVAVSVGYKYKDSFMDFTAATFRRDKCSPGKLLMFNEGIFLREKLHVKLWYLGFKLPYMTDLVTDDSAKNIPRETFQKLWNT